MKIGWKKHPPLGMATIGPYIVFLFLFGCPVPDICVPNNTRCTPMNTVAEICSADGEWLVLMDCSDVGEPGWACCRTSDGCTCLPAGDPECLP